MALKLHSSDFADGQVIPERFAAQGQSVNPRLTWSGVPEGTREFALICEDPDAPTPQPLVHWLIYGLSANTTMIPRGLPSAKEVMLPILARQGRNSLHSIGYTGPNPPFWHQAHRYQFRLFALSAPMPLLGGAERDEFLRELEGKVIETAEVTGLYEKSPIKKRSVLTWSLIGAMVLTFVATRIARRRTVLISHGARA